jgi:hypothetical protein
MSKNLHLEAESGRSWIYDQRSAGTLPETALHELLKWVFQQLNFGNFEFERDSRGDAVSLTIGKAAAPTQAADDAIEAAQKRLLVVDGAGLLAKCREGGIEPEYADFSKRVTQDSSDWVRRNTEFHYAFELVNVLARINKKTFNLDAPPIAGLAPSSVVAYLREATKCWLLRIPRCICRAMPRMS